MRVTIVIPTYNEKENITELVPSIFYVLKQRRIKPRVVIVDDNSPDGTAVAVKKLQKRYSIALLERNKKTTLGSAYVAGFKKALSRIVDDEEVIFQMDGDLSHNPDDIIKFIDKLEEGYDVVIGSRLIEGGSIIGWDIWRKTISAGGNFVGKYIAGVKFSDLTSGYRAYRASVLKSILSSEIKSRGYDFQLEMLWRSIKGRYKVGTVPIIFEDRRRGKSKLSKTDIIRFFLTAMKIRLNLI